MRFNSYIVEQKENIKVLVLTSHIDNGNEEDLYNTAGRIKEECEKRGQECHVIFSEDSYIERDKDNIPRIYNIEEKKGIILDKSNTVVFVRGSVGRAKACLDLVSQIERHEIFCINSRDTIEQCSDKYRTVLCLANADIPTPKTSLIAGENGLKIAFEKIGEKFPVVIKTLTGSKGIGVFTANDWPSLKSTLQTIWKIDEEVELIIQEFIDVKFDIRIHVLGNEVIAAMKRKRIKDDFRSNYSLGGEITAIKLTKEQEEIAIRSSKAVNAIWSGVDMMIGPEGPVVIEINSSPGTEGIEKATKQNIVDIVLDYVEDKDVWTKKTIECGFIEKLTIDGIGELDAKMDTGNGSYCVIHADSYEIVKNKVNWKHNGKKFTHELEGYKDITIGGSRDGKKEKRPMIRLDIIFYGVVYKDIRFTLSDRKNMTTDLLINRGFIRKANLVVNPARKYVLATDIIKEAVEPIKKPEVKKPEKVINKKDKLITDLKKKGFEHSAKGVWINKNGDKGRITDDDKWEPIKDDKPGKIVAASDSGKKVDGKPEDKGKVDDKGQETEPIIDRETMLDLPPRKIDKDTIKQADEYSDHVAIELDKAFGHGIPKKGSFADKVNKKTNAVILQALKDGIKNLDVLSKIAHEQGFSETVKEHYKDEQENVK